MSKQERLTPHATTEGTIVLKTQQLATDQGFRNVAKAWFAKTKPITVEIERLESTQALRESLSVQLGHLVPVVSAGRFGLQYRGRTLVPDSYAAGQLGALLGIGATYPRSLIGSNQNGAAEALVYACQHATRAADPKKSLLLRIDAEESIRGILSAGSTTIRNAWYLGVLNRAVPGARISHWRGDDYTIYGNLLIPDTIRQEDDSDYGAMVSLSNCEIGKRRTRQLPSLFRAICMNGCIWGASKGQAFKARRRAAGDLHDLERLITQNIHDQIPIASRALHQFLDTRQYRTSVAIKPIIAQIAKDSRLSKSLALTVLQGWWQEKQETPELSNTLFGVINAVTRAGQADSNGVWVKCDILGGELAAMNRNSWADLAKRASRLRQQQVESAFAQFSIGA